jgi:hypothetical protein
MYTCATQAVAAQTAGAARHACNHTTLYSNFACTTTLSALLSSHAASRGGEIRFRRARARAATKDIRHVRQLELALLDSRGFAVPLLNLACWAICSRFHYVPGHGRRLRFPSGFWQRLLAPAQSPGEIYTSPVVCLVLSTLGRSSTPRLETLLHSRDRCARPDSLELHTRHFDRPRPRDPRPPRVMR